MAKLHAVSNQEIATILGEIAIYLDMQAVAFKPRAYEKAAEVVLGLEEELRVVYERGGAKALKEIPSIGQAIAEKIEEVLTTGRLKYYDRLKKEVPVNLAELRAVEGLGPKKIAKLYTTLGIRNLTDLERAAKAGKVAELEGFGETSEKNILSGVEFSKGGGGRVPIFRVLPQVRELEKQLRSLSNVEVLTVAGSVRRRKETVGDVDILVVSKKAKPVMDYFTNLPNVERVFAHGDTKSSVRLRSGLQIDLRVVPKESYGAALNYFTGSKDHNVALRKLAIEKGLKLNEYGLFAESGRGVSHSGTMVVGKSEEEIYKKLGLRYIEPEMRENTGEIEAAALRQAQGGKRGGLPELIGYDDLRGDLQVQTDWTDGRDSIEAMAKAAAKRGLEYIAITDHTHSLTITNGLDEKRIVKQWAEIDRVNSKLKSQSSKLRILKGTECDILKNGTLDLPDHILAKLDVVGVSVHSHTKLVRKDQTERIVRAIENPNVDILFHPTGRIVGRRQAYDVDIEAVMRAAKKGGVVLEINAFERLDLSDEHIRRAKELGCVFAINSDAHAVGHFDTLEFGIAQARRGWADKKDVVNAWPLEKMRGFLRT